MPNSPRVASKRTSDVKARVTDETKFALQRRCAELGVTESDYIDTLLNISLFGMTAVIEADAEKKRRIAGMWHKAGPQG